MDDKQKINFNRHHCMVVHAYYPLGETRVEREALALISQGYQVDVICLKHSGESSNETVNGVRIYRLPVQRHKKSGRFIQLLEYLAFFILALIKLASLYSKNRYGSVQVHNLPDFLVFCAIIPKLFGSSVILDIHDLMPDFYASSSNGDFNSFPVRLIILEERLSCRFADYVICVTENAREVLIERGVPINKVSIVMNVADSSIFYRLPQNVNSPDVDGRFNMVYHGTMTRRYGVDMLIQAVANLCGKIPEIRLSLIGGGEFRDELILRTQELNLENYIYFAPSLVHALELPGLLRENDIGIVPNRDDLFTDGLLPTKLMEYIALGIPVVASRTTTISAYFDEDMVLFFEPGNINDMCEKILRIYRDPDLRDEMVLRSDKFNDDYSWEKISAEYVEIIDGFYKE